MPQINKAKIASLVDQIKRSPELQEKVAFLNLSPAETSTLGKHFGLAAAATAGGALTYAAISGYPGVRNSVMKDRNIAKMMAVHPDLRDHDKQMVSLAYDSVSRMAPDVVSDPLMGGQFIKDIALRRTVDLSGMKTLHDMHKGDSTMAKQLMNNVGSAIMAAPTALDAARNAQMVQAKNQAEMALLPHKHQLEMQKAQHELGLFDTRASIEKSELHDKQELHELRGTDLHSQKFDNIDTSTLTPASAERLMAVLKSREALHDATVPNDNDGVNRRVKTPNELDFDVGYRARKGK